MPEDKMTLFSVMQQGKLMVTIKVDGSVVIAPGVSLDDAAKAFWVAVEKHGHERFNEAVEEYPKVIGNKEDTPHPADEFDPIEDMLLSVYDRSESFLNNKMSTPGPVASREQKPILEMLGVLAKCSLYLLREIKRPKIN